jgi:glycosyltransferase involved in cell wall biosynthesis
MAARRPVIASAVGGLSDRVVDGINGYLVRSDDVTALAGKLNWLLENFADVRSRLDYDHCSLTIEDDARCWIEIYSRTIDRIQSAGGRTVTAERSATEFAGSSDPSRT